MTAFEKFIGGMLNMTSILGFILLLFPTNGILLLGIFVLQIFMVLINNYLAKTTRQFSILNTVLLISNSLCLLIPLFILISSYLNGDNLGKAFGVAIGGIFSIFFGIIVLIILIEIFILSNYRKRKSKPANKKSRGK